MLWKHECFTYRPIFRAGKDRSPIHKYKQIIQNHSIYNHERRSKSMKNNKQHNDRLNAPQVMPIRYTIWICASEEKIPRGKKHTLSCLIRHCSRFNANMRCKLHLDTLFKKSTIIDFVAPLTPLELQPFTERWLACHDSTVSRVTYSLKYL